MTIYAMLTVDLDHKVSSAARDAFDEKLAELQWTKLKLTTTWRARFNEDATAQGAISATKSDVREAARHAKISVYEAAVELGDAPPTLWNHGT